MTRRSTRPCALTIAGSDSGGGAGVQADLRTFAAFGVHGLTALTCVTAQTPKALIAVQPVHATLVRTQIESALSAFRPQAVKIGMLYSAKAVEVVADLMTRMHSIPRIVDPVMVSSSGGSLAQASARRPFTRRLLPMATLITPNLPEAEALTGLRIRHPEGMRAAARALFDQTGSAILLKGGHLSSGPEAVDLYYDGKEEYLFTLPRYRGTDVHGTGCTLSAAIAAGLARGDSTVEAIRAAKEFTALAMANRYQIRGGLVLNFENSRGTP